MTKETVLGKIEALSETLRNLESSDELKAGAVEARQQIESLSQDCDAAFQDLEEQVLEAQQSKAKFLSHVTHELRLPLTSIRGYTDLMRQGVAGPVSEQQLNFLNVIKNNVERMSALISDLSDINYIETGRLKLNPRLIYLDEFVEKALSSHKSKILEKEQALEVDIPEETRPVYADSGRVVQIVSVLISNSWKYTPKGGKITLRAANDKDMVKIEVSDNGIGISPEDQEKVFKQFFRSEAEAVREHPGWGLALYLSKQLAKLMGGEMGFKSTLNEGSTFWFTLPTAVPPNETQSPGGAN